MTKYIIGGAAVLVLALGVQTWRVERAQDRLAEAKQAALTWQNAATQNALSLEQCGAINQANEREAERQRQAAKQAELRANMLAAQVESQISQIKQQAEQFNDEQCRTLDEPLPDDFVGWLRDT